jgi:hypothetical protein
MRFAVGGWRQRKDNFELRIADCELRKGVGQRVGGWRSASLEVGGKNLLGTRHNLWRDGEKIRRARRPALLIVPVSLFYLLAPFLAVLFRVAIL